MEEKEWKRGSCLTVFLILMLISNFIIGLYYLLIGKNFLLPMPDWITSMFMIALRVNKEGVIVLLPIWVFWILGFSYLANFLFILAIWKWKKGGIYAFGVSALVGFIINLSLSLPVISELIGFSLDWNINLLIINALSGWLDFGILVFLFRPIKMRKAMLLCLVVFVTIIALIVGIITVYRFTITNPKTGEIRGDNKLILGPGQYVDIFKLK